MPILPEEEEDSPEDLDSSSSSPVTNTPPIESRVVTMTLSAPSIVFPRPTNQDPQPLDQARPHSPRQRLPKKPLSSGNPVTTVDSKGHVIDLVKDQLPDIHLSEEDRQKNRELLEEAKRVSERFLTRRGRKSFCSLSDSSAGASPSLTPRSSPSPSRSSSLTTLPQAVADATDTTSQSSRKATDWSEKLRVSSEAPTGGSVEHGPSREREISPAAAVVKVEEEVEEEVGSRPGNHKRDSQSHATGVSRLAPRAPCTAEIKTIGAFPPLMSAVSWDNIGSIPTRAGVQGLSPQGEEPPSLTLTGHGDFPVQPIKMQKLAKLREENKLVRNQSISGLKLPDLSEIAEQERGSLEDSGEQVDVMPNISDVMLRKLKMHRAQMGSAPPLTEKEVENAFVQLSLAFRNDNYTLETRLRQAERERHLTEENTEKELAEVMCVLQGTGGLWQHSGQREAYHRLLETLEVLRRLATRLSSRAEMVGAVRQEKRMNKATEVMMQYVENLKRTYEKDHAELTEFKKLANQNSSRCYAGSIDTDDGVPRATRSMSLTLGKALPRRRVSVAVVPKFNLLNIPGQTAVTSRPALPVLCETNSVKCLAPVEPSEQRVPGGGKSLGIQERGALAVTRPSEETEEIRNEVRAKMEAKMEEDAFNKGYQEGLRRSKELKELQELQELQEKEVTDNSPKIQEEKEEDMTTERRRSSKYKAIDLLDQLCPKISRQNQTLWIILTLIAVTFFVVSVFTYFRDYGQVEDVSSAETLGPGKNKLFDWTTAKNQPKNPGLE